MQALTHRVQYYETDRMGVTHHSNYIRFMEEARVAYLEQLGFPYAELERRGVISPVTAVNCKYLATTTFDDRITVDVRVEAFNGVVLTARSSASLRSFSFSPLRKRPPMIAKRNA